MTMPNIVVPPKPEKPAKAADETEQSMAAALYNSELAVWTEDYKTYKKKLNDWENSETRMFNLTLQHCTPELEDKLKVSTGYKEVYQSRDPIGLLALIRDAVSYTHLTLPTICSV